MPVISFGGKYEFTVELDDDSRTYRRSIMMWERDYEEKDVWPIGLKPPSETNGQWTYTHDEGSTEEFTFTDVVAQFPELIDKYRWDIQYKGENTSTQLSQALSEALAVHLIDTKRLDVKIDDPNRHLRNRRYDEKIETLAVLAYADELARRMQTTLQEASEVARELDSKFPGRLLQHDDAQGGDVTPETINNLQKKLQEAGFALKQDDIPESSGAEDDFTKRVLALYRRDMKKKLEAYNGKDGDNDKFRTLDKITLLLKLVNDNRLMGKKLHAHLKHGFVIKSEKGNIPLHLLSSGEQHLITLLYRLLFHEQVVEDELFLIDEPEISLHFGWQHKLLEAIEEINRITKFDIMIATHSADIVNGRNNALVPLKSKTQEGCE